MTTCRCQALPVVVDPRKPGPIPFTPCDKPTTLCGQFADGTAIEVCADHAELWNAAAPNLKWTTIEDEQEKR